MTWITLVQTVAFAAIVAAAMAFGVYLGFKARFWIIQFQANEHAYDVKSTREKTAETDLQALIASQERRIATPSSHPAGLPPETPDEVRSRKEAKWARQS